MGQPRVELVEQGLWICEMRRSTVFQPTSFVIRKKPEKVCIMPLFFEVEAWKESVELRTKEAVAIEVVKQEAANWAIILPSNVCTRKYRERNGGLCSMRGSPTTDSKD
ncbi:unnamed protein product, partial [Mesorhabditis belari]|uniref:Uncharacterized protein n=1 Tax=Mesorhabditis belari TaxID=2138241 RepID=A0AAF3FGG8_9BILA